MTTKASIPMKPKTNLTTEIKSKEWNSLTYDERAAIADNFGMQRHHGAWQNKVERRYNAEVTTSVDSKEWEKEWEKEFDKKFINRDFGRIEYVNVGEMRFFIRQVVSQAKAEARREVVSEIQRKLDSAHSKVWSSNKKLNNEDYCEGVMDERWAVLKVFGISPDSITNTVEDETR